MGGFFRPQSVRAVRDDVPKAQAGHTGRRPLCSAFFLGAFLACPDWPTGREEEIAELLFALCFAVLVPLWLLQQRYVPGSESPGLARTVPI
jgi:hypothetical protein